MKLLITGAAGFIGSCLVASCNQRGLTDLQLVDEFADPEKMRNLKGKSFNQLTDRHLFPGTGKLFEGVDFVFHIGARTDTTEMNQKLLFDLNFEYSKKVWKFCVERQIPLIYASSAATYGNGENGFDDEREFSNLKPLNPYGDSKHAFDLWVLGQKVSPPHWYGFKFFNVYGPNEYHKGRMASVVLHAFNQINKTGKSAPESRRDYRMKLFQSHKKGIADGEQKRDFIFVDDLLDVLFFAMDNKPTNGIYNLGTGIARSFNDLAGAIFAAMQIPVKIEYIPTPIDIREKYQYFTQATMTKLRKADYNKPFTSLEKGVEVYIREYLLKHKYR
jgi:ADP-L-glycero-D-manno-heptose 6-epimerase